MKIIKLGALQKKLLILLLGSVSLGLSANPRRHYWVLKQIGREWNKINTGAIRKAINSLYENHLIDFKESPDGSLKLILNKNGKRKILEYKIEDIKIEIPKKWDLKWRIVVSDIPEELKKAREAVRHHLKRLGFYPLQKSVFVFPYECENELEFIIEFYNIRRYVRYIIAEKIDNEFHLKKIFNI